MQIHVIAFDIPYPADYGGVIDVYYKIQALKETGFQVILHCFQYGSRQRSDQLETCCQSVYYYNRSRSIIGQFSSLPFIVKSRSSRQLLDNLCKDRFPILFEGIHTTFWINHERLKGRKKLLRMHNIEWKYYAGLALREKNLFRKIYFRLESLRLKRYEHWLQQVPDIHIFAISENECCYFSESGFKMVTLLSPFHPFDRILSQPGRGNFVLFHGNLGIADNRDAALFLMDKVFDNLPFHLIIAGKNPDKTLLTNAAKTNGRVEIIADPDESKMRHLLAEAQVHVLWSFQSEGVKLKLFYALSEGRFVIANRAVVEGSGLKALVEVADSVEKAKELLKKVFEQNFSNSEIVKREEVLNRQRSRQMLVLKEKFS